jgi:5'-3' exonuclease
VSTARRRARSGAKGVRGPGAVHLVDASPYVFRAWFALKTPILSPAGADVGAVLGFAGFLLRHLADHAPTHVAVAFDESLTTSFRNELYAGYKAGRETPPPELVTQLAACRAAAEVLGCATFADARYEADDLIATWCRRIARVRRPIVVVSPDKDLMQLVDGRVELLDAARGLRYGPDDVREKLGVAPAQVTDWLGLAGDPVDDIPGVPGVGAKTAAALLGRWPRLEELFDDLDGVAGSDLRGAAGLARRLAEGRALAFLSRELATVARVAPIGADTRLAALERRPIDVAQAEALFGGLGLRGLLERVRARAR